MEFYVLMLANLIGAASLAGWLVAWAKLDGLIKKPWRFGGQRFYNVFVLLAALAFGVMTTLPIGGTSMPAGVFLFQALLRPVVGVAGVFVRDPRVNLTRGGPGPAGPLLPVPNGRGVE